MSNDKITAEIVEIQEFPELSDKYQVFSVPKTVLNEEGEIIGAVPESIFLEKVLESYSKG